MSALDGQAGDRHRRVERDRRGARLGRSRQPAHGSSGRHARRGSTSPTPSSCERFVEGALAELGGLDILVNNAGLGSRARSRSGTATEEDEREVIETNVLGLMRMTRLCLPHLLADGDGHIVNLGSVAGIWSYAERLVVRRIEVRRARLHARAARRPPGQAGARHERRPGCRRDELLEGAVQGRRGEGGRGLLRTSRWAAR